ncbi:hypothetical protein BC829DRAFT_445041 [Chytridium lagenaria]|nr:hypothetical protein BC829DRAFT_445041 [Chytridium lagenaria]
MGHGALSAADRGPLTGESGSGLARRGNVPSQMHSAAATINNGLNTAGHNALQTAQNVKTSYNNGLLAVAGVAHECNNAVRHVVSGSKECCPVYHSCISTKKDISICQKEYQGCRATRSGAGAFLRTLKKSKLKGGDCTDPTKAAKPEGKACCPPRATCIKKSKAIHVVRECETTFLKCIYSFMQTAPA